MPELVVDLDRETAPAGGGIVTASIRIQPGEQVAPIQRQLTLCVDKSGSMDGEKIERVREGILWVFGYLEADDYVSVVAFDDDDRVVVGPSRWADLDREAAEEAVESIEAGGGTDVQGALERARGTFLDLPDDGGVGRRILLLTDGRDTGPAAEFEELAGRLRREDGISVPTAGVGKFYDREVVRTIGTASGGEWIHLEDASDVEDFFGRKVESLATVVAPNPHLQLDVHPDLEVEEVLLRQPQVRDVYHDRQADVVRIYLPDLVEFERQEVVLELRTPPCEAGERIRLADVTLQSRTEVGGQAVLELDCAEDPGRARADDHGADVSFRHLETEVRRAVGAGDLDRAETIIERAGDGHDEAAVGELETVIDRAREGGTDARYMATVIQREEEDTGDDSDPSGMETVIQREGADGEATADDEDPSSMETVIQREDDAGSDGEADDDPASMETVIQREDDDPEEDPSSMETVIQREGNDDGDDGDEADPSSMETVIQRDDGEGNEDEDEDEDERDREGSR